MTRGRRPKQGEPVIDRALRLLECFETDHRRLTLGDLSQRSGIPLSSAYRLAERLIAWGALERDEEGRYAVGLRLYEVASLAPRGLGLRERALPYMGDLAEATRQHVLLAVRDGEEALLVERLSGHRAMPVLYRVGGRLPLHSTGVGLVLLAFAEHGFREAYLARRHVHEPEHAPVSAAELRHTIAEVRRERLSVLRRTVPEPLVSVAGPVFGADDTIVAALSVLVPEGDDDARRLGPPLMMATRAISRALGARRAIGLT
ncbi:MAG: IclR family transcriptional regulator [Nocardioides sp.]|uniref:IclR family transcriptional regulator n=1 Tax=Nocardioides sp. TaxID=35761 RepID=UPI0039E4C70B